MSIVHFECGGVLANNSLNARNLHRHVTTRHAALTNKPLRILWTEIARNVETAELNENSSHYLHIII
jgi:glycosylphosphatidylinositol transamidase (GPIT) subunit GPI8